MDNMFMFGVIAVIVIIMLSLFFHYVPFVLWLAAKASGVNISLLQLFMMRIRKVPPHAIVQAMIEAHKAGLDEVSRDSLEAHYLAGGHVERVVHALVSASKANIDLSFQMATAIDLAGRDVFEAVQMSVNPKVLDTPHVTAVAKDGIQLIAIARVTVRANIKRLVGGAGEDTVLARVGEGIVSSIGSAESHKAVLENPDSISKLVLTRQATQREGDDRLRLLLGQTGIFSTGKAHQVKLAVFQTCRRGAVESLHESHLGGGSIGSSSCSIGSRTKTFNSNFGRSAVCINADCAISCAC